MLLLWAIVFIVLAIVLGALAFGGIAVAVSFFTKILFLLSLLCFLAGLVLILIERVMKKEMKDIGKDID